MLTCPPYSPDFFIVGAPKCGTTALYDYLKTHPNLYLPAMKEPTFFAEDIRNDRTYITDPAQYKALYDNAGDKLCGDASPYYMGSSNALANIMRCKPDAKIIAIIRNPLDMLPSYFAQALRFMVETETDIEKAWRLQDSRAKEGASVNLQYKHFCSLGSQLKALIEQVPAEQLLVLVYDDFKDDTRGTYTTILEFLGVPDDGRTEFPRSNIRKKLRSPLLQKAIRTSYHILKPLRPVGNALGLRPFAKLSTLNQETAVPITPMSSSFQTEMAQEFEPEIQLLEQLLNRDFPHWRHHK